MHDVRVPGEGGGGEAAPADKTDQRVDAARAEEVTRLNNTTGTTANSVGADREAVVRAQAVADAARRGVTADLAPEATIGAPSQAMSTKRKAVINGVEVEVDVPIVQRNSAVETFGPESRLPKGAQVKADGTPCEGNEEPAGVVGDINTPQGKLVNRILWFKDMKAPAARAP